MCEHKILKTGLRLLDGILGGGLLTGEVSPELLSISKRAQYDSSRDNRSHHVTTGPNDGHYAHLSHLTQVSELVGRPGCGKSQLCHAICAQQAATGACNVLYIDTGNSFSADRVNQLMLHIAPDPLLAPPHAWDKSCQARLEHVRVCAAPKVSQLCGVLEALLTNLSTQPQGTWLRELRLVIVDSVFGALAADYTAQQGAASAQLARLQQLLRELALRHRLAVILTNTGEGLEGKSALGYAWQCTAHLRLLVSENVGHTRETQRSIRITESCHSAMERTATAAHFTISCNGVASL